MLPGEIFNPFKVFVGLFIPNVLASYKGLSPSAKIVWGRLAQFSGSGGRCFPSQEVLADEVGLSERQIRRVLDELASEKFIVCQRPTGMDRLSHKGNNYAFLWHAIFDENVNSRPDINVRSGPDGNVLSLIGVRESALRESKGPPRKADIIATEKATTAFEEFETQLNRHRKSGAGLQLDDKITIAVVTNDLGGKSGALALCGDELRKQFVPSYVRRELAAFHKNRRAG